LIPFLVVNLLSHQYLAARARPLNKSAQSKFEAAILDFEFNEGYLIRRWEEKLHLN